MRNTAKLFITILLATGLHFAVTGCNDSSENNNPSGPGDGTEIPDDLRGIWVDAASSMQYRFTDDNVESYIRQDDQWVLLYDYQANGYDIVYDGTDSVSIYLAEIYTIGFSIGENGNLYSDGADLFMTKLLVVDRRL